MNKNRSADKSVDLEFKNGHSEKYAAGSWTIYPQSPTKVRDFFLIQKKRVDHCFTQPENLVEIRVSH